MDSDRPSLEDLAAHLPEFVAKPSGPHREDSTKKSDEASTKIVDKIPPSGENLHEERNDAETASKWIKGALIGTGPSGNVYLGMDPSNGLLMAVKQVELPSGSGHDQDRKRNMISALERQVELLKPLQHENIVPCFYSSVDEAYLNIFLEYAPGGSVASLLRTYGAFEESLVRNFVRQILQGLNYLHERDIIHRNIKGSNLLINNSGVVKISDIVTPGEVDDTLLVTEGDNTMSYLPSSVFWMAPEVVKQTGHTSKADIWSLGCAVIEMLTGEHPWAQLTQAQAISKIGSSERPEIPSDISPDAIEFLHKTFELDPIVRPSASELLQHSWVAPPETK